MTEHLDVLVVGAGLSGIGTAAQLRKQHPHRSLAVLEMRAVSGGTWDLIRYGHRVVRADWHSETARWLVDLETPDGPQQISAGFLVGCTGYYDYEGGYAPTFPGQDDFAGQVIHPQHWPEDLDYAGKRVVVIGSGATA